MAVEDGALLGTLLGLLKARVKRQDSNVIQEFQRFTPAVLKVYEELRKHRTTMNTQGAFGNRLFFHMPDGPEQEKRDKEMMSFDFLNGRSEHPWLDTEYQQNLLGHDSLAEARTVFAAWWESQSVPPALLRGGL